MPFETRLSNLPGSELILPIFEVASANNEVGLVKLVIWNDKSYQNNIYTNNQKMSEIETRPVVEIEI